MIRDQTCGVGCKTARGSALVFVFIVVVVFGIFSIAIIVNCFVPTLQREWAWFDEHVHGPVPLAATVVDFHGSVRSKTFLLPIESLSNPTDLNPGPSVPVVFLLHGIRNSKEMMIEVIEKCWPDDDVRFVAVDLIGHNESPWTTKSTNTIHANVRSVANFLVQHNLHNIPQLHIVGYSMGSAIALELCSLVSRKLFDIWICSATLVALPFFKTRERAYKLTTNYSPTYRLMSRSVYKYSVSKQHSLLSALLYQKMRKNYPLLSKSVFDMCLHNSSKQVFDLADDFVWNYSPLDAASNNIIPIVLIQGKNDDLCTDDTHKDAVNSINNIREIASFEANHGVFVSHGREIVTILRNVIRKYDQPIILCE